MASRRSALDDWSPEQRALGRTWADTWRDAGPRLEAIRRQELRSLDTFKAVALLCSDADYHEAPHAPAPSSGLVEQQRLYEAATAVNAVSARPPQRPMSSASVIETGRRTAFFVTISPNSMGAGLACALKWC
jgi:hypothetical protein